MNERDSSSLCPLEQHLQTLVPRTAGTSVADAAYEAGRRDAEMQVRAEAQQQQARREMRRRLFVHRLATAASLGLAVTLGVVAMLDRQPTEQSPAVLAQAPDPAELVSEEPVVIQPAPDSHALGNHNVPVAQREPVRLLPRLSFWLMGDSTATLQPPEWRRSPHSYLALRSTILTDDAIRLDRLPHSAIGAPAAQDASQGLPPTAASLLREVASWDL